MRAFTHHPDTAARPPGRRPAVCKWGFLGLALCWLFAGGSAHAQEGQESAPEIRGFSIPNTRSAKVRMAQAREHIAAKRWNESLAVLQELIDFHRSELVPIEDARDGQPRVFRGAAGWAAEQLCNMPPEARALYARRHGAHAMATLDLARRAGKLQGVIAVAERWPTTPAALRAWWTLGDLELEAGNLEEARQAWARALTHRISERASRFYPVFDGNNLADWQAALEELAEPPGQLGQGEQQRTQLCLRTLGMESSPINRERESITTPRGSLRLPGPGEGASGCPGPESSSWPRPFQLPKNGPFELGRSNLFPIRMGDTVFVTDSLQLFAIHAYSGALRWASELPKQWLSLGKARSEFFAGISREDTMIAPAASQHIVVSAHQIPVSDIENEEFHNISITTVIPDRRLYAYDTQSGAELWNHHPPPGWDGESGGFVDRMSVAGPPVIAASRVIVPAYRMHGRIEFYTACYDLVSGELLWSTQLVSGQRELNMFARSEKEFSAPPVRVEQDRVVVATQLGALAVLDLFSGRILWESLYDTIAPPRRSHFNAKPIKNVWRNAPPVVADGVVIVTPFDCRSLLGLDLETGETLWSLDHNRIERISGQARSEIDLLIGADDRTVFLGSWPVIALRSPGGLHREAPSELSWRYPGGHLNSSEATSARALVLKDRVLIPTHGERIEVDRFGGGRRHKAQPWKGGRSGNLLVQDGTLYALSSNTLDGYFEWDMLLARGRQEYERKQHDQASSLYLASLLAERSRTRLEVGRTLQAREHLTEAEELLTPWLAGQRPSLELSTAMHNLLRTKGKLLIDLANSSEAAGALRRARQYAPSRDHLRDTLIEEYMLARGNAGADREEILTELLKRCADRTLRVLVNNGPQHVYGWRFDPVTESSSLDFSVQKIDIPMWIMLERAANAAIENRVSREFEELHALLEYWPDEGLPTAELGTDQTVSEFAGRRIGELIEIHGRNAYVEFEQQARKLLARARATRDRTLLEVVSELYPHSLAGREANDDLLQWAIGEGDVEAVSRIALSELPEEFEPGQASPRQIALLLCVAATLENAGNTTYAGALYRNLAQSNPELRSAAPSHDNKTLAQLAGEHPRVPQSPTPPDLSFKPPVTSWFTAEGDFRFLGAIPPALDSQAPAALENHRVLLYIHDQTRRYRQVTLTAFSSDSLSSAAPGPLWSLVLPSRSLGTPPWKKTVDFLPGVAIVTVPEGIFALDRETGHRRWTRDWESYNGDVESINTGSGLVLASVRTSGEYDTLYAFDGHSGREVWQASIDRLRYDRRPLIGEDRVVLMPRREQKRGQVLDIFSGRKALEFELPSRMRQSAQGGSWIEDGQLIVPWFLMGHDPVRNRLLSIDLWSAKTLWDLSFAEALGGRRQLRSILQHAGKTYLILTPNIGAQSDGVHGILAELHVGIGAIRRVGNLELEHNQRFIGVNQERRVVSDTPTLYLHSLSGMNDNIRVQAVDLPYGNTRWISEFSLSRENLYNSLLKLPMESDSTVAMVFSTKKSTGFGSPSSTLFLLDKGTGQTKQARVLDGPLGTSNQITLQGLGPHILLGGDEQFEVLR